MTNKENYIKLASEKFIGKTKEMVLQQIELFFNNDSNIKKNKYDIGENVLLKKGTFIHGIFGNLENFDYTIENGFISTNFTGEDRSNKICNSVGMWNIKKDILLKDYINQYSGFTIIYSIGKGSKFKEVAELVPYHKFDEITEKINNNEEIWSYWGNKTKEVSFLPSLVSEKRQIAFILNMESEYAKKLKSLDVWNNEIDEADLEPFIDYRYFPKFVEERKK